LQRLRSPVLALFGELDNNIVAEKNKSAWESALKAGLHVANPAESESSSARGEGWK